MMRIDVAVGEVAWERSLLDAIAMNPDVQLGRRYVDLAAVTGDSDMLIACPSVRGFTEEQVARLAHTRPLLILQDTVRPPWLATTSVQVREIAECSFAQCVLDCVELQPSPKLRLVPRENRGRVTAFVGISGGVGVTTLTWLFARGMSDALLIEGHERHPGLALLIGNGRPATTLGAAFGELRREGRVDLRTYAVRVNEGPAVLALPLDANEPSDVDALAQVLVAGSQQFAQVIVDLGDRPHSELRQLLEHVDEIMLVTVATPLGLVRLCADSARWQSPERKVTVVVNRVRASAAGSRHVATAMRNVVRTELGCDPVLVPDLAADCDRGWLSGDWGAMASAAQLSESRQIA